MTILDCTMASPTFEPHELLDFIPIASGSYDSALKYLLYRQFGALQLWLGGTDATAAPNNPELGASVQISGRRIAVSITGYTYGHTEGTNNGSPVDSTTEADANYSVGWYDAAGAYTALASGTLPPVDTYRIRCLTAEDGTATLEVMSGSTTYDTVTLPTDIIHPAELAFVSYTANRAYNNARSLQTDQAPTYMQSQNILDESYPVTIAATSDLPLTEAWTYDWMAKWLAYYQKFYQTDGVTVSTDVVTGQVGAPTYPFLTQFALRHATKIGRRLARLPNGAEILGRACTYLHRQLGSEQLYAFRRGNHASGWSAAIDTGARTFERPAVLSLPPWVTLTRYYSGDGDVHSADAGRTWDTPSADVPEQIRLAFGDVDDHGPLSDWCLAANGAAYGVRWTAGTIRVGDVDNAVTTVTTGITTTAGRRVEPMLWQRADGRFTVGALDGDTWREWVSDTSDPMGGWSLAHTQELGLYGETGYSDHAAGADGSRVIVAWSPYLDGMTILRRTAEEQNWSTALADGVIFGCPYMTQLPTGQWEVGILDSDGDWHRYRAGNPLGAWTEVSE